MNITVTLQGRQLLVHSSLLKELAAVDAQITACAAQAQPMTVPEQPARYNF